MLKWLLLLVLFTSTLQAALPNTYFTPSCIENVGDLPIYRVWTTSNEGKKSGTVVLIGDDLWRTAAHVLGYDMDAKIVIETPHGSISAKLVLMDTGSDVAYLTADSKNLNPIPRMTDRLGLQESVWTVGYPGLFGNRLMSFAGVFARYEEGKIITSSIAFSGMSGGAALRCNGKFIEMVGTITHTKRVVVAEKVWIEADGTTNKETYMINAGYSIIAPVIQEIRD